MLEEVQMMVALDCDVTNGMVPFDPRHSKPHTDLESTAIVSMRVFASKAASRTNQGGSIPQAVSKGFATWLMSGRRYYAASLA